MFYVLDEEGEPLEMDDWIVWATWMEYHHTERVVSQDTVVNKEGADVGVSTVFLGINHNFVFGGPPILWETMIFGGPYDRRAWRYSSRKEAMDGHVKAMALVLNLGGDDE